MLMQMQNREETLQMIEQDVRSIARGFSSAITRLVFGLIIVDLLIITAFLWKYPPIHSSGVSLYSIYAIFGAVFFMLLFLVLGHEEKRRILKEIPPESR
jgi:hypothetical protein